MGRHSRKGRGDSSPDPGIRTAHGASPAPAHPGPEQYDTAETPQASAPGGQFDARGQHGAYGAHESDPRQARPYGHAPGGRVGGRGPGTGPGAPHGSAAQGVRGGHPEQYEPGGGWGAGGAGQGPAGPGGYAGAGATVAGAVLGATGPGTGVRGGPKQEYLDAFDDDVFAAGAPGGRGARTSGAYADLEPEVTYAGASVPGPRVSGAEPPEEDGETGADGSEPPDSDGRFSRRQPGGGKGRTFTGITAAAVTTVLAVVIAGHVSGGQGAERTDGAAGVRKTDGQGDRAAGHGTGAAKGEAHEPAPLTYDDRMARPFALAKDAEGSGKFRTVGGHQKGPEGGKVLRYRVDVEKGLPLQGELFAEAVHKTLNDKRSWAGDGERSFERVSSKDADFVITLAGPKTTDVWCAKSGLDTSQQNVSCDSAATERVMINGYRWAQGAETYGKDRMHQYRQMLINHEVGHRLGHDHVGCAKEGALAPVMMQQTKYLSTDGRTCKPNAWPHPRA